MKEFNLKEALKGHPVVLRNGLKAYVRHIEEEIPVEKKLLGVVVVEGEETASWCDNGRFLISRNASNYDIVGMWEEEPLTFDYWDILHEDLKYLAYHPDTGWCAFKVGDRPTIRKDIRGDQYWESLRIYHLSHTLPPHLFPEVKDWKTSLIERP